MTAETSNARWEWALRLTALDGLVDRIAEAIRDGAGLAEGDPPWERLGEERRAPWRADAKRALSVIKESLTTEMGAGVGEPDVQYADADALIAHLDGLYDDNGQGGDKWDVAQAAIAGIRAARRPAAVRGLVAKWRERAATNSGAFAAAANVVCADELEAALAAEGVQPEPKPVLSEPDRIGLYQGPDDCPQLMVNDRPVAIFPAGSWAKVCDALDSITGSVQPDPKAEARGVVDGWKLVVRYGEYDKEPGVWAEKDGSFVWVAALAAQRQEPTT